MIPIIEQIREDHPRMSAREIYKKINPTCMGRDKFEQLCFANGFRVKKNKNFRKTTNSNGVIRFPNLIATYELTGVNQVFVSDITYYELPNEFNYQTFIMDLFSREIVGFSVSSTLRTEGTSLVALKMAEKKIGKDKLQGAIFHSDGGGQYYDEAFLKITNKLKMLNSMGREVYDNPHAERVNGTIKNDYVIPWNPDTSLKLYKYTAKAINNYNHDRPHKALGGLTPCQFRELFLKENIDGKGKKKKEINTENNSKSYFPVLTSHHQNKNHNKNYKQAKTVNTI